MQQSTGSASARVLTTLKESGGGLTVKDLCRELDLSSMAVRRQLAVLEGRDLISRRREKQKTGRPAQLYFLTDAGHEEFQRDYSSLAVDLLLSTRDLLGKEQINQLLKRRNRRLLEEARSRVRGKTLETRVHEVCQWLSDHGYMARWERLGSNRYLIKEMNCAVAKVAKRFPQVCIFEEHFLGELLRAKVWRREHILQKDQFCAYVVEEET
ncbi:MAG TPA: MarR family transcriptional regulator [Acidobacteriota bacterium]|nr:MarR family transcriptional regulator [Acidobacteriota bacterium]